MRSTAREYVVRFAERIEEIYRDGGRRTSGVIITFFITKLVACTTFIETTREVHQNGVGGAYFSGIAACVAITMMAPIAVELKTKAPGARTFLQVMRARFGTSVHCLFCVCALSVNVGLSFEICSKSLTALMQISSNVSNELVLSIIIFTVGVTLGFGGTSSLFSSSYVITAFLVFVAVLTGDAIFYNAGLYPLGDCNRIVTLTACQRVQNGTTAVLSFRSLPAIYHALDEFGTYLVFLLLDQSFWQGILSSEPETSGFNLIASGFFFLPVAAVFGTACGLGYFALNMSYGQVMLSSLMERLGLIAYSVMEFLFGRFGSMLFNTVIFCTVTACTCSEVISISSVFVVDVYMTYIRPFKKTVEMNNCVLCGLRRARSGESKERCRCKSMAACVYCQRDDKDHQLACKVVDIRSTCPTHGEYRQYIEHTRNVRIWTIITVLAVFLFGTMLLDLVKVSLINIRHYVSALCGSVLGSLFFAFYWARVTHTAVFAGFVVGTLYAIGTIVAPYFISVIWLEVSSIGSIFLGAVVTALYTLITTKPLSEDEELEVWERTRSIDDPLQPWSEVYGKDLGIRNAHLLTEGLPRLDDVQRAFSFSSKILKYASILLLVLYLGVLPAFILIPAKLTFNQFQAWISMLLIWLSTSFMFLLIIPPVFGFEKARYVKNEQKASQYIRRQRTTTHSPSHYLQIVRAYFRSMRERIIRALPLAKKNN
ncbi:putative urea active transporter 1 [Taenia crassiceps]|uniref:Urea active transporter 1 n=1 Tax=Taenia crassiceps TaxID=6207 RepID=A0ABR4QBZ7_9CEST